MEVEKQRLLLSYLISSEELFTKVSPILKTKYFSPKLKPVVDFVANYFDKYKGSPTPEQIQAETGETVDRKVNLSKHETLYAETQLEQFCRNKAIESAIMASPDLLEAQKFGEIEKLIRDAITVGINRNIGLDYFADPEARLKLLLERNKAVSTLWWKLDEYLGGGLNRKEMIILGAPSGVGKSITMSNLSHNLVKQNLTGIYFTLELAEEVVAKRFDSMFSGISQADLLRNITKASIEISKAKEGVGQLFIKRLPESSTNANHLRAYLKEFEIINGFTPDFVVVDYLDLMASVQSISAENTFIRDKFISEELRAIANDYNLIMITASQLNRGAQMLESIEDLNHSHVAGGLSKIMTADNMVAIIQDKQMKARGEMMFKMLKTRNSAGVNNVFMLKFDPVSLRLQNIDDNSESNAQLMSKSIASYARGKIAPSSNESTPIEAPKQGLDPSKLPFQV